MKANKWLQITLFILIQTIGKCLNLPLVQFKPLIYNKIGIKCPQKFKLESVRTRLVLKCLRFSGISN